MEIKSMEESAMILFQRVLPERVKNQLICEYGRGDGRQDTGKYSPVIENGMIQKDEYEVYAMEILGNRSHEEIQASYDLLTQTADRREDLCDLARIFTPLLEISEHLIRLDRGEWSAKMRSMLDWRRIYLQLGQDLFTTCLLGWKNHQTGRENSDYFWQPVIRTDDPMLQQLYRKGIVDNHTHLKGSSQNFVITWACLMNHPEDIEQVAGTLRRNLMGTVVRRNEDLPDHWASRLRILVMLRYILFQRVAGGWPESELHLKPGYRQIDVERKIQSCRKLVGEKFWQGEEMLDYALCVKPDMEGNRVFRLCAAERWLMTKCFERAFGARRDSAADRETVYQFYLYLLLKGQFRNEFIQMNDRFGFENFKQYETRKDKVFEHRAAYEQEMYRMAVLGSLQQSVTGIEARIAPSVTEEQNYRKVREVYEAIRMNPDDGRLHFAFHFIKKPEDKEISGKCRNEKVRQDSWSQAYAIVNMLRTHTDYRRCVLAIDAASTELGCRPEVFAPVFRYLRYTPLRRANSRLFRSAADERKWLHVTYHAGEDFMDIADGMRSIDEAMEFLHLRQGERLGHATAVGVDPEIHYRNKGQRILINKQDLLDNDIWLLRMIHTSKIRTDVRLMDHLRMEALSLIRELYGVNCPDTGIGEYENSWWLRQDPPEWYKTGKYRRIKDILRDVAIEDSDEAERDRGLDLIRKNEKIARIYACYHYDRGVRKKGQEIQEVAVTPEYIDMIRAVQGELLKKIARREVIVECNPSSNCVIGSFREYELHPIFRMCPPDAVGTEWPMVTINTDDTGIFDTSLEQEYSLIAAAMKRTKRMDGTTSFGTDDITSYMEKCQKNGELAWFR